MHIQQLLHWLLYIPDHACTLWEHTTIYINRRAVTGRHITLCGNLQGLQQTVLFCGDGINDLSALSAADVGYAVGSTEASIAAAVTSRGSVTGDSTTLQDSCGSPVMVSLLALSSPAM